MKTIQKSITLLMLFVALIAQAQETVTGVVVEAATGTPLPGVNVIVKGTTRGTATDFDGNFTIEANRGETLLISYIGFISQEIEVTGQAITVGLEEDAQQLGEVVVIGYGTVKKEDATAAVNVVSTEDFNQGPIVSAQQLIQGKVAGVNITTGSGSPGDGAEIRIRGNSSLSLDSNPLYVVDGVPLDNASVGGSRNILNLINPNDIESMSILKDAAATSIYGARAANGVIMITTKKGKAGELKFNYRNITSVYQPVAFADVLEADEFRQFVNDKGTPEQAALLGNANTDWQDLIFNSAFGSDHAFNVQGGIFNMPFRASVGYTDQGGILKGDEFERLTGSFNLRPRLLNDDLLLEFNARIANTKNQFANRGAIGAASNFDPTQPVYDVNSPYYAYTDDNGTDFGYFTWLNADGDKQLPLVPTNPLALLERVDDQSEVNRFIGNVKADYNLPFVDGLKATVNVGYDYSKGEGDITVQPNIPTATGGFGGDFSDYSNETKNYLFDAYFTYRKDFDDDNFEATAGYSYQKFESDNISNSRQVRFLESGELDTSIPEVTTIDRWRTVLMSYFGRANYSLNNKYLFNASVRADASSQLAPDNRWRLFPAASFAWNIHNEDFMGNSFLNQLKLRIGYGEVGNLNGLEDYGFLTRYFGSNPNAQYQFGNQFYNTYRPETFNENLEWEVGTTFNVGLDFAFWNSRLNGSVNVYNKITNNLIFSSVIDPFTNFGNVVNANIGDMENRGVEFELGVTAIETENFSWTINYNVAYNDNTITNIPDEQLTGGIAGGTGNTVQILREGETPFSFYVYKQIYDADGNPIEGAVADLDNNGEINENDRYIYKDPFADVIMGLSTSINWNNWDFQAVTRASLGNYAYNNTASNASVNQVFRDQILNNVNSSVLTTEFNQLSDQTLLSDYYIENASFFRLDNVTLGYTLQEGFFGSPLRIYGAANNLFVISDYSGLDPEIFRGIDNNFYPRPRVFVLGVDLNF